MFQERKEYRKKFNSSGQVFVAGELLEFNSYDVSVNGVLVEIIPGIFLTKVRDFEAYLSENTAIQVYVKDLKLSGEASIAWVKEIDEKLMLGLEFVDVMNNAEKFWRKRQFYRKNERFSGTLIIDERHMVFQSINVSVDGLALIVERQDQSIEANQVVKIISPDLAFKGLGKIVWVNNSDQDQSILGLRYLAID